MSRCRELQRESLRDRKEISILRADNQRLESELSEARAQLEIGTQKQRAAKARALPDRSRSFRE